MRAPRRPWRGRRVLLYTTAGRLGAHRRAALSAAYPIFFHQHFDMAAMVAADLRLPPRKKNF